MMPNSSLTPRRRKLDYKKLRGMTLVELAVTVSIAGILATAATVSFKEQINQSRSVEAVSMLSTMQKAISVSTEDSAFRGGDLDFTRTAFGRPAGMGNDNSNGSGNSSGSGSSNGGGTTNGGHTNIDGDGNNGHGNNADGCDPDNPGNGSACDGSSSSGSSNDSGNSSGNGNSSDGNSSGSGSSNGGGTTNGGHTNIDGDGNNGHGNNADGCDPDNPATQMGMGKQCGPSDDSPTDQGDDGGSPSGNDDGDGAPSGSDDESGDDTSSGSDDSGSGDGLSTDGSGDGSGDGSSDSGPDGDSGSGSSGDDDSSDDSGTGSGSDGSRGGIERLCDSASPVPSSFDRVRGKAYNASASEWSSGSGSSGWSCLNVGRSGMQRYQFGYDKGPGTISGASEGYTAWARGDLDGDGRTSLFRLSGDLVDGRVVNAPAVDVIDGNE